VLTHASDAPTLRMPPPALLVIGLIAFCAYFAEGAVDNWSGVFLHEIRNASYAVAPLGTTLCGAGMAVARFRGDAAITRFGRYLTLAGASVVACAGLALAVTARSIALSILGFGIFGVGTATIVPIAFTLAGNVAGTRPSWAISRVAGFGYAGLLSSPAIIGFVAGAAGLSAALLIPAVLLLAVLPASAAAKDS
jgi:hypothetical protein